jgi:hypothetical protein
VTVKVNTYSQCCGSGIRCFLEPWIQNPGSGMITTDLIFENFVSVLGLKILNFLMRIQIRDLVNPVDPGSRMDKFGSGIRDKHPESATLHSLSFLFYVVEKSTTENQANLLLAFFTGALVSLLLLHLDVRLQVVGHVVPDHSISHLTVSVSNQTLYCKSDLYIHRNETARPCSQFLQSCICERFI